MYLPVFRDVQRFRNPVSLTDKVISELHVSFLEEEPSPPNMKFRLTDVANYVI